MIEGFDKEIDALLRQTAKGEAAPGADNFKSQTSNFKFVHLDPDEISTFAENALPEKTRLKYTAHFADCDRCRKILSNTISLNSEAEIVADSSRVSPKTVAANIPLYRRLFAFPNAAYALGALVVLLGGFLAFSILQNGNNSQNAEVSQISENRPTASGPSAEIESDSSTFGTMSNTNMTAGNMNTTAMPSNSVAVNLSNTSTATSVNNEAQQRLNTNLGTGNTALMKKEATLTKPAPEAEKTVTENDAAMRQTATTAESATGNQILNNKQTVEVSEDDEKIKVSPAAPPDARLTSPTVSDKRKINGATVARKQNAESSNEANKQISGKTFNRRNGVWYDSAFNGQSTTNVSRGSDEYKKLDSGLRSIADNLGGTVVIVWKNKAYRVQ